jgi:hypothetical protein
MPYKTDDIECAEVASGNSLEPSAYCQYLIEGQEFCLCETNADRPYYILLEAGRNEEIVVFHTERFIDTMTRRAGVKERKKTDFAMIGKYRDISGQECATVVFLEMVDRLEDQIQHKIDQCDDAYEFFCRDELNFNDFHSHIPDDVYRAFGDFRQHKVVGAIAPQRYDISRGKYFTGRLVDVYPLSGDLFVDRRSQKARLRGRSRNVNFEQAKPISLRDLLDAMDGIRC